MGENPKFVITRVAGEDLNNHQFCAVTLDANGKAVKAVAGVEIFGILQRPAHLGEAASIMIHGVSMAKFSGAVTGGQKLVTDANGQFKVDGAVPTKSGALSLDPVAANGISGVLLK